MGSVLIITAKVFGEDDAFFTKIADAGHHVATAVDLAEGLRHCQRTSFDAVVMDETRMELEAKWIPLLQQTEKKLQLVVVTDRTPPSGQLMLGVQGTLKYMTKEGSAKALVSMLDDLEDSRKAVNEMPLPSEYNIFGRSKRLHAAFEKIRRYAPSRASVLLQGATGTGKELFAKALHSISPRRKGPLVTIDCASLPETLVESLLFGYTRGAFTGASTNKEGLIKLADGGTLFLDEVGELSLDIQRKFLRVLQERRFRPVGGGRETSSDFRLVAATNRNLPDMIAKGTFREDLYYRLRILHIQLPLLSEREDDIMLIAQTLLDKLCDKEQMPRKQIAENLRECLLAYPWPGNVRELVNVIESCFAVAGADRILRPEHLPPFIHTQLMGNFFGNAHFSAIQSNVQYPERRRLKRLDRRAEDTHKSPLRYADRRASPGQILPARSPQAQSPRQPENFDEFSPPHPAPQGITEAHGAAFGVSPSAVPAVSASMIPTVAPAVSGHASVFPEGNGIQPWHCNQFFPFREERRRILEQFEKEYLTTLHACHSTITEACKAANLSRPRLYELYRKYGILHQDQS